MLLFAHTNLFHQVLVYDLLAKGFWKVRCHISQGIRLLVIDFVAELLDKGV